MSRVLEPGATVVMPGSGQLGRMFTVAAHRMGYRVHTVSAGEDTPMGQAADVEVRAACDDLNADRAFASLTEAVPEEFVDSGLELSVLAPRSRTGGFARFGACRNTHVRDIPDVALAPRPARKMGGPAAHASGVEAARERTLAARRKPGPAEEG